MATHTATITIDNTKVAADATDFPVYVDLSDLPTEFWDSVADGGGDIRVFKSDDTTELPREVVSVPAIDNAVAQYNLSDTSDEVNSYTLTNNNTVTFSAGKVGNAANFNGTNQSLNNNSVLGATSYPRSFSGWVNFDSVSGDRTIFSLSDGTIHYYNLKIDSGSGTIVFRSNNNTQAANVDTGITPTTGTWYHWAVVQHSSTSVSIYIDGTKTNTTATTFVATVSQFYLGYLGRSNVWWLDGQIDGVRIHNDALTDEEVLSLYNAGDGTESTTPNSRTGELHIKYSGTLSSSADTDIHIYTDGTSSDYAVTDTYGRNNVWGGYEAVYHLEDVNDYTGNSNTLTNIGTVTFSDTKIGKGAIFGSANTTKSLVKTGDIGSIGATGAFSWSCWVYMQTEPTSGQYQSYMFKRIATATGSLDRIGYANTSGTKYLRFYRLGSAFNPIDYTVTLPTNTWMNFHYTYDGSNIKAYYNGVQVGSTVASTGTGNITGTTGFALSSENATSAVDELKGNMDESRVTSATLSADWITTEYNNQNSPSTFYTASAAGGGGGTTHNAIFAFGGM